MSRGTVPRTFRQAHNMESNCRTDRIIIYNLWKKTQDTTTESMGHSDNHPRYWHKVKCMRHWRDLWIRKAISGPCFRCWMPEISETMSCCFSVCPLTSWEFFKQKRNKGWVVFYNNPHITYPNAMSAMLVSHYHSPTPSRHHRPFHGHTE